VRELRNIIERLIIMVPGPALTVRDVPPPVSGPRAERGATAAAPAGGPYRRFSMLKDARTEFEREFITEKLKENGGNVSKTADAIGVERSSLHRKIKAYGIEGED
jgi:two-component system nitrogen regulation response regulator NtrX